MSNLEARVAALNKPRVWFYRPALYWFGPWTLSPILRSHDEYSRYTLAFGWTFTGRIIFATGLCGDDDCYVQTLRWEEEMGDE